jgi:tetratricopeptide (TPR) repeat protein
MDAVPELAAETLEAPRPEARPAPGPQTPTVAGYEIVEQLGRGGMGVVFQARQVSLDRLVALKMILAGAHAGPEELARFRAEADAVARLQHPNIVQIYEIGQYQGGPYFALEFVDGGSLAQKVAGEPFRAAAQLVERLARAVHYAHQRGIVHRDLKPANVLLARSQHRDAIPLRCGSEEADRYEPKITDFGLAKRLEGDSSQTRTGAVIGTPSYMAPEQAVGRSKDVGPAADVWALGAMLYEMLTGRPPFRAETPMETLLQVQSEDPVPPARLQRKVPRDLETICLKCLQKEPHKRYASADELAQDLSRLLADEPILARPVSGWERAWKLARRHPAAASLVGVGVLGLLAVILGSLAYSARLHEFNVQLQAAAKREREQAANARDQRDVAQRERARAEANYRRAIEAVDELTRLAQEQLAELPQTEAVRQAVLEKVLTFYAGFLEERSTDPAVRFETGRAHQRVAELLKLLGEHAESRQAYGRAIELFDQLAREFAEAAEYRHELAVSQNGLAELLRTVGESDEAERGYRRAMELEESLVREFPAEPKHRRELARACDNLGILLSGTGRAADAEQAFGEAIGILQSLVRESPDQAEYQQGLARSYLNLGPLLRTAGRLTEAESAYDRAIQLLDALVARLPNRPAYRHELAVTHNNRGNLLNSARRFDEANEAHGAAEQILRTLVTDLPRVPGYRAELANTLNSRGAVHARTSDWSGAQQAWREAVTVFEQLAAEFPEIADHRGRLGMTLGNVGWLLRKRGDLADAPATLRAGIDHLKAALSRSPANPALQQALRFSSSELAEALVQTGEHSAAADAANSIAEVFPERAADHYAAARLLARCISLAEQDANLAEPERQSSAENYADRAVRMLAQAVQKGFHDAAALRNTEDFERLRQRDDFQTLLRDLEQKTRSDQD